MTSRKKSGKGKGKRNGRTKRGGFLGLDKLFDNSFPWFGNSEKAKTDQTAETKTGSSGGWFSFSNLINKFKPPTTPENQTPVIPGRPPQQSSPAPLSPQQQSLSPQQQQSLSSPASLSPQQGPLSPAATLSQPPPMQPPPMQPPPPMQSVAASGKGGKRRRSSIKKRK
jgi:hypothetical protein